MAEKLSPSGKLIVDQDGAVTTITLNRPRVHNALDQEISAELNSAVKDVAVDRDCRVLILRGAGDTFCAGDDIKGFLYFAPDDGPWNIRMYQETVNIIDNLVPVTIAGVLYSPNQVRKVNLHVGVRSDELSGTTNDYIRNHLSTVVSIRSLAFVNRYP